MIGLIGRVVELVGRVVGLLSIGSERGGSTEPPAYHDWMYVSLVRRGKRVRDLRCKRCGVFRRSPDLDVEICRAAARKARSAPV